MLALMGTAISTGSGLFSSITSARESIVGGDFIGGILPTAPHGRPNWPNQFFTREIFGGVSAWTWAHNPGYWAHALPDRTWYLTPKDMPLEEALKYFPAAIPLDVANQYLADEHKWIEEATGLVAGISAATPPAAPSPPVPEPGLIPAAVKAPVADVLLVAGAVALAFAMVRWT